MKIDFEHNRPHRVGYDERTSKVVDWVWVWFNFNGKYYVAMLERTTGKLVRIEGASPDPMAESWTRAIESKFGQLLRDAVTQAG